LLDFVLHLLLPKLLPAGAKTSMKSSIITGLAFALIGASLPSGQAGAREPRIVNIYNFVRNSDYRVPHSEEVLYEATRQEIELILGYSFR
jgi:hypothetical protein